MRDKKINVIILGPRFPAVGGIPRYIDILETYLTTRDINVIPITPYVVSDNTTNVLKDIIFKIFIFIINLIKLTKHSKDKHVIAHVHTAEGISFIENSFYILLFKMFGTPTILHIHATKLHSEYKESKLMRILVKYIFNNCDSILVLSNAWKREYGNIVGVSPDKLKVVHNGTDIGKFKPISRIQCRRLLQLPHDKKIIFSLGALVERKGFKYLIDAMADVINTRSDVLCVIGGKGNLFYKLQQQINKLNLQKYVKLIGFVPEDELVYWLNAADLFVLPSLSEGSPLVIFESLATGLPVIGTTVGAIPEIITSNNYGLLVNPANSKELSETILIALEKRWSRKKIRKYAEQFNWENIARQILDIYKQVLQMEGNT